MDVLSPAVGTGPGPGRRAPRAEAELNRLRARVARLEAERAALEWAVGHDDLTGLANRGFFCGLAPPLLGSGRAAVVIVLDLNGFKPVNDRWGHDVGDCVLRTAARRLAAGIGHDRVARLGGDEFAGVITCQGDGSARDWWRRSVTALSAAIAEPVPVAGQAVRVTAAIGVAPACDGVDIGELLRRADLAMYQAKATGSRFATWSEPRTDPALTIELTLCPLVQHCTAPTLDPHQRNRAELVPARSYRRDDPVWVHREGTWHPGVVEDASGRAALVTYRRGGGTGTVVDTVTAEYLLVRTAVDPQLDRRDTHPRAAA